MEAGAFLAELNDLVGCRVGLAVPDEAFVGTVREIGVKELADAPRDTVIRMRSDSFARLGVQLLAFYGDPIAGEGSDPIARVSIAMWRRDRSVEGLFARFAQLLHPEGEPLPDETFPFAFGFFVPLLSMSLVPNRSPYEDSLPIDRDAVLRTMGAEFGSRGVEVAEALFRTIDAESQLDPFSRIERYAPGDVAKLESLYSSRELVDGLFLDQRFINFLAVNVHEVDRIHWRKFEGLCATYFAREGYEVEIGPGANDDGVDLRLWQADDRGRPALTIVQCKRQRNPVEKAVVKALFADMLYEEASHGVVATTATLSPGARRTITSRRYPLSIVDREAVESWLVQLRSPGTGLELT